ncbi:MAG: hypothetical protein IPP83_06625 [Flavobacteriales bacterium]|nr:hypothetical protein [Flavobacteriales bacterium]
MRHFLQQHRWATVLVVFLLLFATSSMTLSRMTCLMGGHSVLSFGPADDCCPDAEKPEGTAVKAICCAFTEARLDRTSVIPVAGLDLGVLLAELDGAPTMIIALPVMEPVRWWDGKPPPRSLPDRLAELQVMLI